MSALPNRFFQLSSQSPLAIPHFAFRIPHSSAFPSPATISPIGLMVKYAAQLHKHGTVIMTLKLPEQKREPVLDHAFNILREAYTIMGARQLFHNRSEITVYLRLRNRG